MTLRNADEIRWEAIKLVRALIRCPKARTEGTAAVANCIWGEINPECRCSINIENRQYEGECPIIALKKRLNPAFLKFWKSLYKSLPAEHTTPFLLLSFETIAMVEPEQIFFFNNLTKRNQKKSGKKGQKSIIHSLEQSGLRYPELFWIVNLLNRIALVNSSLVESNLRLLLATVLKGTHPIEFGSALIKEIEDSLNHERLFEEIEQFLKQSKRG